MLAGKRILIVEDEQLIALMLEDMIEELGARPIGPAPDVARALALIDAEPIDAALLDVNLGHERSDAIADRLAARGTPFVVATGYGREFVPACGAEVLVKPYRLDQLKGALSRALGAV